MSKSTQEDRIVDYMQRFGGITQLEALRDLGVMRLASRVSALRQKGVPIKSETVAIKNRFGEECRISRYSLI